MIDEKDKLYADIYHAIANAICMTNATKEDIDFATKNVLSALGQNK